MVKTLQNLQVLSRLNEFRKTEKFCDVVLVIDGVEFPVHKNVLAGFSLYFEAMFSDEFKEAQKDRVSLVSVELGIMESLLEYAYTAEIDLTNDNIQAIIHAANFLQVQPLFKACCDYLESTLNAENCIGIFNLSEVYPCDDLHNVSKKYILENFRAVTREVDFLELEAEKLINIIDDDTLFVEKEEHVFDAVLSWFHYKEEDRERHLLKVLSHVRLSNVDPYFLHTRLKGTKALLRSEAYSKLFLEALFYQALPNRSMELCSSFSKLRTSSPYVEVLLLSGDFKTKKKHGSLCVTDTGDIIREFEFPTQYLAYCSSTSNYELFYVDKETNVVSLFDYKKNAWTKISMRGQDLTVEWLKKALRNLDGRWFTFEKSNNKIEVFDDSVWRSVPEPMADVLVSSSVVFLNGMIYLLGGKTKCNKPSKLVQQFDPHTETWTWVGDMPSYRDCSKTCAFNGRIYVFSESIPSDSDSQTWPIEEFDVSTGLWSSVGNVPEKFLNHKISSVTAFRGSIYVLFNNKDHIIQVYSPLNNSWSDFPTIPDFDVTEIRCPMRVKRADELIAPRVLSKRRF